MEKLSSRRPLPDRPAWLGIELRHLAAFEAIATEGSFRRAAVKLGYGQSAISQQVAALERIVGRRLVDRSPGGRSVRLTPAGEVVLRHARAIVSHLQAADADVAAAERRRAEELRIGVTEAVAVQLLPQIVSRVLARSTRLRLRPTEASSDLPLFDALAGGKLDLAFVELPAPTGPFELIQLMRDPYLLLCRRDRAPSEDPLPLHAIEDVPLIRHRDDRGARRVEDHLEAIGLQPEFMTSSSSTAVIQALVGAGIGAAILPALAIDRSDPLVTSRLLMDIPARTVALARNSEHDLSAPQEAFIRAAQEVCDEVGGNRHLRRVVEAS